MRKIILLMSIIPLLCTLSCSKRSTVEPEAPGENIITEKGGVLSIENFLGSGMNIRMDNGKATRSEESNTCQVSIETDENSPVFDVLMHIEYTETGSIARYYVEDEVVRVVYYDENEELVRADDVSSSKFISGRLDKESFRDCTHRHIDFYRFRAETGSVMNRLVYIAGKAGWDMLFWATAASCCSWGDCTTGEDSVDTAPPSELYEAEELPMP